MNVEIEALGACGRVKPISWQPFTYTRRQQCGTWWSTSHLQLRIEERHIPSQAIATVLELADLFVPLEEGKMKLSCSRRAIKRACHAGKRGGLLRHIRKLVVVVSEQGAILTAWEEQARSLHPLATNDSSGIVLH